MKKKKYKDDKDRASKGKREGERNNMYVVETNFLYVAANKHEKKHVNKNEMRANESEKKNIYTIKHFYLCYKR